MFTGIIKEIGAVKRVEKQHGGMTLAIQGRGMEARRGGSVAVNGVCLTIKESVIPSQAEGSLANASNQHADKPRDPSTSLRSAQDDKFLVFDIMPETIKLTTLGQLKIGDRVNLEPSQEQRERLTSMAMSLADI